MRSYCVIEITLPFPPSTNHVWRWYRGRVVLSAEGRRFREQVWWLLRAARVRTLKGPVVFQVDVHPPNRRQFDLDNRIKSLLDACQHGGAFDNDNQVVRIIAQKCNPVRGGKAVVRIEEAPP